MKDLLGGVDRIEPSSGTWSDGFIVNLGLEEFEGDDKHISPHDLGNWHVDGDFFVCFVSRVKPAQFRTNTLSAGSLPRLA
jgi:hypothetical protein